MLNLISNLIKKFEFEPNFKVAEFEFEPEPCDIAGTLTAHHTTAAQQTLTTPSQTHSNCKLQQPRPLTVTAPSSC